MCGILLLGTKGLFVSFKTLLLNNQLTYVGEITATSLGARPICKF